MTFLNISTWDDRRYDLVSDGASCFLLPPDTGRSGVDGSRFVLLPGLADVHVHLREPGFSYKETVRTGTQAAAAGGFTDVCPMPNLNPAPDSPEHLRQQLELIARDALIGVHPYGCITAGEKGERLADLEAMSPYVTGFSDDGVGLADEDLMRQAMRRAKALDKPIAAHCEVLSLVNGGCIHDGTFAHAHHLPGISSESEWRMIQRDLRLVAEIGCRYHVCHVSAKESVALIREAKRAGLPVTCETAPHYLALTDDDLRDEGRFKMNPPIRTAADRDVLREGLAEGTVDLIATDHAPHSAEEKAGGLLHSKMGVVGLETALSVVYTTLVRPGLLRMSRLADAMSLRPRSVFRLDAPSAAPLSAPDAPMSLPVPPEADRTLYSAGFVLFDPTARYTVDPSGFRSLGCATPFDGRTLYGQVLLTVRHDRVVFQSDRMGENL